MIRGEKVRATFSASVFVKFRESITEWSVLLVFHKRFNMWLPIGGEMEHGETPSMTAVRELREETGLFGSDVGWPANPMPCSPPGLLGYEEHSAGSRGWHLNFIFQCVSKTKDIRLCDEHDGYVWLTRSQFYSTEHCKDATKLPMPDNVKYCINKYILGDSNFGDVLNVC